MRLIGIDQLARIHAAKGVPQALELAEGVHKFSAEHLLQQRTACLAVTMFAGDRAAEAHHQIGSSIDELSIDRDATLTLEVEVDAQMHAPMTEVTVHRRAIAIL